MQVANDFVLVDLCGGILCKVEVKITHRIILETHGFMQE